MKGEVALDTTRTMDIVDSASTGLSRRAAVIRLGAGSLAGALVGGGLLGASAQDASPAAGTAAATRGEYLAIRQYTFAPGHTMGDLEKAVESGFMPIVSQVPGFVSTICRDCRWSSVDKRLYRSGRRGGVDKAGGGLGSWCVGRVFRGPADSDDGDGSASTSSQCGGPNTGPPSLIPRRR